MSEFDVTLYRINKLSFIDYTNCIFVEQTDVYQWDDLFTIILNLLLFILLIALVY